MAKEIVELFAVRGNDDLKYTRPSRWIAEMNGERIGSVQFVEKYRHVEDEETPEQQAERERNNFYTASVVTKDSYKFGSTRNDREIDGEYQTVSAAKYALVKAYKERDASGEYDAYKRKNARHSLVSYLPAGDADNFFPTPSEIAGRMFCAVDWTKVGTILEPSAGKGDLLDALTTFARRNKMRRGKLCMNDFTGRERLNIDCIEIDQNLRYILTGKGYRVVQDDFLTYNTSKPYDLILMNPPFADGDKHLLKALEMQSRGGQIVCLLNAETLRNAYTKSRKTLIQKLGQYSANIQYIKGAFVKSERPSDVDIALVTVSIPNESESGFDSEFFDRMEKAREQQEAEQPERCNDIAPGDMIERMVREYEIEVKATLAFLHEYAALCQHVMANMDAGDRYNAPIIKLSIGKHKCESGWYDSTTIVGRTGVNEYLRLVRSKYWHALFDKEEITGKLTSSLCEDFKNSVKKMAEYEFSFFNIEQVIVSINAQIIQGVEKQIMSLFDTLSAEHAYYDECKTNIHYYTGWKTNKAHKVGMKAILPINGFSSGYSWKNDELSTYTCSRQMHDLELTLDYLDGKRTPRAFPCYAVIENANRSKTTRNLDFKYWTATFYKKGTVHLKFKDATLIDALNIFAGRNKNWLPPFYGKKRYNDMDADAQAVIDEFQGKEAYDSVLAQPDVYLVEASRAVGMLGE